MLRIVGCSLLLVIAFLPALQAGSDPPPPGYTGSCTAGGCHAGIEPAAHAHPPVAAGACTMCHRPASDVRHEFRLAREGADLCSSCHRDMQTIGNPHCEMWPGGCTICHDPHGTGHPKLLPADHVSDACSACHPQVIGQHSVLHTPVAGEPCTVCHDPHETKPVATDGPIAERCFGCHDAIHQEMEALNQIHEPVKAGTCDACHDPHGSDSVVNLHREVPELCYGCHEEIRATVETSKRKHSVAAEPGGCLVCHTPHGSTESLGLRDDPFALCSECHSKEITDEQGKPIVAVAHDVETAKYLHGPVRQRDCGACHDPHGSDHHRLLVEPYSEEFYAAFDLENYRLCFSCHPQRGVLTEKTTALTGFRNGNENLHYLHVNKPGQGRTCRACHETHGSNDPKHIRGWVQFGSWRLPIKFTKTETGGSCETGCHRTRGYDRDVPVDNSEPEAQAQPPPTVDGGKRGGVGPAAKDLSDGRPGTARKEGQRA